MIEQIMFFALGALAATLVALMILPAVWNRAVRLTTRRVESAVPVSIFEIQAAKDHQRAQFALNQRRLEIRTEDLQNRLTDNARELERRRLRIVDLERAVSAITAELGTLSLRFAAGEAALLERTEDLALTRTQLAATQADLAAREAELADVRASLDNTGTALAAETGRREEMEAHLAERDARLAEQAAALVRLEAAVAALAEDLAATRSRADAAEEARISMAAERARLEAALAHESEALAAALTLADTRAGIVARLEGEQRELAAEFTATRNELSATRAVAQATEVRRAAEFSAAETESRRLRDEVARLGAEISMLEGALVKARGERDALVARDGEMDTLRVTLSDLAARLVARAAPDLAGPLEQEESGAPSSLAERIRAVRQEASVPTSGKKPASRRSAKG